MAARRFTFDPASFRWDGIGEEAYKFSLGDERGMGWKGVSRHTLGAPADLGAGFELRYFELERGGYSSVEKHEHVHFVIAVRGTGRALVGESVLDLGPFDALYVPSLTPHRWINEADEPFGFLCTVDAERDAPKPLDDEEWEALRANPATAPYIY
ncbi:MAG: cupin domain-containing protein [Thermoleophilaceae bacterium]